jgi:hypothetical protein
MFNQFRSFVPFCNPHLATTTLGFFINEIHVVCSINFVNFFFAILLPLMLNAK